jgi:hypothetical protein
MEEDAVATLEQRFFRLPAPSSIDPLTIPLKRYRVLVTDRSGGRVVTEFRDAKRAYSAYADALGRRP